MSRVIGWGTTLDRMVREGLSGEVTVQPSPRQPHAHLGTKHVSPRGQPVQRPHSAPPWKRRHLPSLSCFHLSLEEFFEEEENNSNKWGLWLGFAFSTGSNKVGSEAPWGQATFMWSFEWQNHQLPSHPTRSFPLLITCILEHLSWENSPDTTYFLSWF